MLFRSDRKSTRLNFSHLVISYAVFCLKKKKNKKTESRSSHRYQSRTLRVCTPRLASQPAMGPPGVRVACDVIGHVFFFFFFFNDTATTEIYTLSLHDALPI